MKLILSVLCVLCVVVQSQAKCSYYGVKKKIVSHGWTWDFQSPDSVVMLPPGAHLRVYWWEDCCHCPPAGLRHILDGDTLSTSGITTIDVDQPGLHRFDFFSLDDSSIFYSHTFLVQTASTLPTDCHINVGALLGGAWHNSGLMRDDLRQAGLLPAIEPYSGMGWTVTQGAGMVADSISLADHVFPYLDAVDWILVELRNAADSTQVLHSIPVLLKRNGWAEVEGLQVPPGHYFVAVRHRNHLGIMTSVPVPISTYSIRVNLASYGFSSLYRIEAMNVINNYVVALWPGDAGSDGQVSYTGMANDRDAILQTIGGVVPTQTVAGYLLEDLNLDGVVKYVGADNDRDLVLQTIGSTYPTAVRTQPLP